MATPTDDVPSILLLDASQSSWLDLGTFHDRMVTIKSVGTDGIWAQVKSSVDELCRDYLDIMPDEKDSNPFKLPRSIKHLSEADREYLIKLIADRALTELSEEAQTKEWEGDQSLDRSQTFWRFSVSLNQKTDPAGGLALEPRWLVERGQWSDIKVTQKPFIGKRFKTNSIRTPADYTKTSKSGEGKTVWLVEFPHHKARIFLAPE